MLPLLLALLQQPQSPALRWVECTGVPVAARCGYLDVPEDHDRRNGRRLELFVVVIPARVQPAEPDPLVELFGGPGDFGSRRILQIARSHAETNQRRDVVIMDQRGTGRSSSLFCAFGEARNPQSYVDAFLPTQPLRRCRDRIAASADLARYRTVDHARDIEALRVALRAPRLNLLGSSYGTRAALHYAARYPDRVRTATLIGVAPPELVMPMSFPVDAERAIGLVFTQCAAETACRSAFPAIRAELDSVLRRLDRAPARAVITDTASGTSSPVTISRAVFGEAIRAMLYTPAGGRRVPLAIHEAFRGNFDRVATVAHNRHRAFANDGSLGLYLAVTCVEDIPRLDTVAARAATVRTTLGAGRLEQHLAACTGWPRRPTAGEWPPVTSIRAPVLMISGELDPVTPPAWADRLQRQLPRSRHIIVPGAAHGFAGMENAGCPMAITSSFVAHATLAQADTGCLSFMRAPSFALPAPGGARSRAN